MGAFDKIFGSHSDHEIKRIIPLVDKIDSLRPEMQKLSDDELRGKTQEFKDRLAKGETLDDLLPEAFAVNREAAKRVLGMEHFRVQLIGGIILHQGRIAEMKTGEGKTLVATLPAYLNALEGKGVQIVTVNDYLAHRDSEWMGKVHAGRQGGKRVCPRDSYRPHPGVRRYRQGSDGGTGGINHQFSLMPFKSEPKEVVSSSDFGRFTFSSSMATGA